MAYSGAQTTRPGLSGFARGLYGSFASKTQSDNPIVEVAEKRGGAGGWRRHGKRSWWVIVGDERHKVTSKVEEQGLIQAYVERKEQELALAVAGTETAKARGIRISLTRAIKRLEATKQAAEKERIQRLMQDDEDLMFILSLH